MDADRRLSEYLGALEQKLQSLKAAGGMPAFESAWAFLEQLARISQAPDRNATRCWRAFVLAYLPQPDYLSVSEAYGSLRSRTLHNYHSATFAYTESAAAHHLSLLSTGERLLNLQRLVSDLSEAFARLRTDLRADRVRAARALTYLDENPPIRGRQVVIPYRMGSVGAAFAASASWGQTIGTPGGSSILDL